MNMKDKFYQWWAWHLPRRLVYWCFVRVAAHATVDKWGNETPDSVSVMTAMARWEAE